MDNRLEKFKHDETFQNKLLIISKFVILVIFFVGLPLFIWLNYGDFIKSFKDLDEITQYLAHYEKNAALVFILLEIIQLVISVIPGGAVQIVAGYFFKLGPALLYCIIGCVIGTTISFWLARILGHDFISFCFGKEKTKRYEELLNSKRSYITCFIVFLIPGLPKDMISYVAGATGIKYLPFLLISLLGRMPGLVGSIIIGAMTAEKNYLSAIIILVIATIILIICVLLRKKISNLLDNFIKK